ncbi:MAG: MFS transporter, partial [Intestinibacter sp.]|uniref:MFS transporter n=1 Tax=Intestinibacter sp. TaxID=1965304 RepID=UPI003F1732B9
MVNKLSAYKTYLLFSAITAMCFSLVATVMIVYHIETVHLNPLQLILVGTTLEVACFIFEIPTGIVADVYSRKLSIVIGVVLTGVGFILEGSISSFVFVLVAQIVWGLGSTFISGSVEAWIAEEEKDKDLDKIYIKGAQAGQIGSVIGIVLSTVIANLSVRLPIIVSGVLFIILALFLWLYMPENNFKSSAPEDLNTFKKMGYTFKSGLKFIKNKYICDFQSGILGLTVMGDIVLIPSYDDMLRPVVLEETFGTVLISPQLLGRQNRARRRYTEMHEASHFMLHQPYFRKCERTTASGTEPSCSFIA